MLFDSEHVLSLNFEPCMAVLYSSHAWERVWLHETKFCGWQRARFTKTRIDVAVLAVVASTAPTASTLGVKVLWCHSYLVWLVFEGSIPTSSCCRSEK